MSKFTKIILVLALVLGFLLMFFLFKNCSDKVQPDTYSEDATVLLERIEQVAKLITVEGYFSEVYKYKDYYKYDISFLRKQALMRIQAKVAVGYDLSGLDLTVNESNKKVIMVFPDSAQILSIEHDLDYYDISEGTFNSFDKDDYNKLNASAKDFIREKALQSDLFDTAGSQLTDMVEIIRALVSAADYTLEVIPLTPDEAKAPQLSN